LDTPENIQLQKDVQKYFLNTNGTQLNYEDGSRQGVIGSELTTFCKVRNFKKATVHRSRVRQLLQD